MCVCVCVCGEGGEKGCFASVQNGLACTFAYYDLIAVCYFIIQRQLHCLFVLFGLHVVFNNLSVIL